MTHVQLSTEAETDRQVMVPTITDASSGDGVLKVYARASGYPSEPPLPPHSRTRILPASSHGVFPHTLPGTSGHAPPPEKRHGAARMLETGVACFVLDEAVLSGCLS
ncbi:hypothetical protein E4U42_000613 [Claviceps africana]|uniref:Uncharacterized protein n=1 Tax=Claviceps africana TaxID=83212 RepID=A0A8K0IZV3_9HYPO|nr:hypothetical protein E4U42_000613 [Claviceps africana]